MNAGTVQNNVGTFAGLFAAENGSLSLGSSGSVINNAGNGVFLASGGAATVNGTVAGNSGNGVNVYNGGAAAVSGFVQSNTLNGINVENGSLQIGAGPTIIQNNKGDGIFMSTNSVASFASSDNQIINNTGWGILCAGAPANPLTRGPIGTVSGNTAGQISCNVSP